MKASEIVVIPIALWLLFGSDILAIVDRVKPTPAPTVPVTLPDAQAQAAVAPVVAILKGHPSRQDYAGYWASMGKLIQQRPNDFKSVGDIVAQHRVASELFYDLDPQPVPGLANAMETAIRGLVGEDDRAITQAEALRVTGALTWACSQ